LAQTTALLGGPTGGGAAFRALRPNDPDSLLAYALLGNIGTGIVALSWPGGEATLILHFVARFVALALGGVALALLRRDVSSEQYWPGLAWRAPVRLVLYGYAVLSLAGLPLTPGFASHWAILGLAAGQSPLLAALLVLTAAAVTLGLLRALAIWLAPPEVQPEPEQA
jgi:NADH-quinone oxidoreductase subunit N